MPNSLSLSLTESALFLRAVHIAHHTRAPSDNAPPSILRALLILSLAKPTRISSIKVELVGQSITIWTEGKDIFSTLFRYIGLQFGRPKHALPRRVAGEEQDLFCHPYLFPGAPYYHWPACPLPRSWPLLLRRPRRALQSPPSRLTITSMRTTIRPRRYTSRPRNRSPSHWRRRA